MHERSIAQVLNDIKVELKDFISTRVQMLVTEMREKIEPIKASAPMFAIAALLAVTAFIVFSFGLVAVIAAMIHNPYNWAIAAGAVTLFYLLVAGVFGALGYQEVKSVTPLPKRTMRVLQDDKQYLNNEVRVA